MRNKSHRKCRMRLGAWWCTRSSKYCYEIQLCELSIWWCPFWKNSFSLHVGLQSFHILFEHCCSFFSYSQLTEKKVFERAPSSDKLYFSNKNESCILEKCLVRVFIRSRKDFHSVKFLSLRKKHLTQLVYWFGIYWVIKLMNKTRVNRFTLINLIEMTNVQCLSSAIYTTFNLYICKYVVRTLTCSLCKKSDYFIKSDF